MRRALLLLTLLLLHLLLPQAAFAQVEPRFELTPTVGYRFDGEFDAASDFPVSFDLNVRIDEGATFGLLFDVPLNANWSLELLANRQESAFVVDEGLFTPEEELGDVTVSYYHAGFLYQWGPGQVRPFVTAAVGLARIAPDFPEVEAENRFSGSLAGGVKIFFAENVGLRLEGRGFWADLETGFEGRYSRFDSDEGLYQAEVNAGLVIAF